MSNFLAPAMVSESLRHILTDAASRAVPGAQAVLGRPSAQSNGSEDPGVNIFPYQVSSNSAWSNVDLPTRNSAGTLTRRPQIGLDLFYLFSFRGSESDLVPELLMGSCMSRLHAQPVLTREIIEQAIEPLLLANSSHVLRDADLAEQVDQVKLTPIPLNLEELSKLWAVFQVPYILSVAYQASVVLIEEAIQPAAPALPVRERRIFVEPFRRIRIASVESSAEFDTSIYADSTIRIIGTELGGQDVAINISGETILAVQVTAVEITVDLSVLTSLQAGILPLYVVHRVSEDAPQIRFESNVVALTVSPQIQSLDFTAAGGGDSATIDLELFPAVADGQSIRLFLNQVLETGVTPDTQALAYVIEAEPLAEEADEISIPVPNVEAGTYLVRIQVDGAESDLEVDGDEGSETFARYIGPTVLVI